MGYDGKERTAILVAASIIAAIRLRGEPILWSRIVPKK
jgi:hypothetical protein